MWLRIRRALLLEALAKLGRVIPSTSSIEVLTNIFFKTLDEERVKLIASDLEINLEIILEAEILEKGDILIPAKLLIEAVKKMEGNILEISVDYKNFTSTLRSRSFEVNIHGQNPFDYPKLYSLNKGFIFELSQSELKEALRKTLFAVGRDPTRAFLTGIYFSFSEKLRIISADGHRLALYEMLFPYDEKKLEGVIIPLKAMSELSKILKDEDNIKITIEESYISFDFSDLTLTSRLIGMKYPNLEPMLKLPSIGNITLDRAELIKALERSSLLKQDKNGASRLTIKKGSLSILTREKEVGNSQEELTAKTIGEELILFINTKYLAEGLRVLDEEEATIEMTGNLKPVIIKEKGFTYIVMPMINDL